MRLDDMLGDAPAAHPQSREASDARESDVHLAIVEGVIEHELRAREGHSLALVHGESPSELERKLQSDDRATRPRLEEGRGRDEEVDPVVEADERAGVLARRDAVATIAVVALNEAVDESAATIDEALVGQILGEQDLRANLEAEMAHSLLVDELAKSLL